jgi:hypothetical protein
MGMKTFSCVSGLGWVLLAVIGARILLVLEFWMLGRRGCFAALILSIFCETMCLGLVNELMGTVFVRKVNMTANASIDIAKHQLM